MLPFGGVSNISNPKFSFMCCDLSDFFRELKANIFSFKFFSFSVSFVRKGSSGNFWGLFGGWDLKILLSSSFIFCLVFPYIFIIFSLSWYTLLKRSASTWRKSSGTSLLLRNPFSLLQMIPNLGHQYFQEFLWNLHFSFSWLNSSGFLWSCLCDPGSF